MTTGGDQLTVNYFDQQVPDYGLGRLKAMAAFIRENSTPDSRLLDIGCGTGKTLAHLATETGISKLHGADVSSKSLQVAHERTGCETSVGSITDPNFMNTLKAKFDFAVVVQVLHHLVGPTRSKSRAEVPIAIANSLATVKPGGWLIILEPAFDPAILNSAVFWTKQIVTTFTSKRIAIGDRWNNLGAPVVSYYTRREMETMLRATPGLELVECLREAGKTTPLIRACGFRKEDITWICRKLA